MLQGMPGRLAVRQAPDDSTAIPCCSIAAVLATAEFTLSPLAAAPAWFADAAGSVSSGDDDIRWYAMPYRDSGALSGV
jgi:hypothetical protein